LYTEFLIEFDVVNQSDARLIRLSDPIINSVTRLRMQLYGLYKIVDEETGYFDLSKSTLYR